MRKFLEDHELKVLLILVTMLGVTRWWMPSPTGFENVYSLSHWALSYDFGLVRRGLLGAVVGHWIPVVTIVDILHITLVAFCFFLALLLVVFYFIMRFKDRDGRLFRIILLVAAAPATIALCARDLGRFDLFLAVILLLSFMLLSRKRYVWLIPLLMTAAMFIHEGFMILWAPTMVAAMIYVYVEEGKKRSILATLLAAALGVAGAFLILYNLGNPTLPYEEFAARVQSRAAFHLTELSMRESYFSLGDHTQLAASSLYDAGSIASFLMAILVMSPVLLVFANLWTHAFRGAKSRRLALALLLLATLSGFLLVPIATDHGRWLSAAVFCNFFALLFLIDRDVIDVSRLEEYAGGSFPLLFVFIVLTYLLFGPLHDWNPYPYKDNVVASALSTMAVLLFDIGFCLRWRSLEKSAASRA